MRGVVCCGPCARTIAPAVSRVNCLVALQAEGDASRADASSPKAMTSTPRRALSPDGTQLAWLSWNHPDMPWDGCELWLAEIDAAGHLHGARRMAGSRDEAVQQPLWSPDGRLHFISDRSGWWNLYRWGQDGAEALCPMDAEFGQPMWNFGLATYGFSSARRAGVQLRARRGVAAGRAGHGDEDACARSTHRSAASATWRYRDIACCSPAHRRCRPRRCACCTWTTAASRRCAAAARWTPTPTTARYPRRSSFPPPAA